MKYIKKLVEILTGSEPSISSLEVSCLGRGVKLVRGFGKKQYTQEACSPPLEPDNNGVGEPVENFDYVTAPYAGVVHYIEGIEEGTRVEKGMKLGVVDKGPSSKYIMSPCKGTIEGLLVGEGLKVEKHQKIIIVRLG